MKEYIEQNKERFFEELFTILRIPSISAKPDHKPDMYRCADAIADLLKAAGADEACLYETDGNPVVYGEKKVDPSAPTVLVYGHYDVQPPEPLEKWRTDPFEPVIHDGAIWCRGANDDKGQLFMHIKAFEYLLSEGLLRHNVKFIFEGEEEIGSPSLPAWIKAHRKLLKADICLVSDTTMISEKVPSINCGMRGLSYLEVKVTGPNKDLHSGHYGGAVANPIQVLCEMISSLIGADGKVTVPGFYDDVVELSRADRRMLSRAPYDEKEYKECIKRLDGVDNAWELFNYVVQALDNNQEQDFLGGLYMNLDLGSHWHGQFFTPYDICRMMAKISLNGGERDAKTEILDHGYISINDPACGAGATLIAAANQLRNQYINYQTDEYGRSAHDRLGQQVRALHRRRIDLL